MDRQTDTGKTVYPPPHSGSRGYKNLKVLLTFNVPFNREKHVSNIF
jgi:hypothetical protein